MELFCVFWAKLRSLKGETNIYGLYWGIQFHYGQKRSQVCILGAYLLIMNQLWTLQKNTKFSDFIRFYCVQWLFWGEKLHLLNLLMEYDKWEDETSDNWAMQVQVMPFWTDMYLSRLYTFITHFKVS